MVTSSPPTRRPRVRFPEGAFCKVIIFFTFLSPGSPSYGSCSVAQTCPPVYSNAAAAAVAAAAVAQTCPPARNTSSQASLAAARRHTQRCHTFLTTFNFNAMPGCIGALQPARKRHFAWEPCSSDLFHAKSEEVSEHPFTIAVGPLQFVSPPFTSAR